MTSTTPTVVFQPLHEDVIVPSRSTDESAGYDVRAYLNGRTVKLRRSTQQEVSEATVTGGKLILEGAEAVLRTEFADLYDQISMQLPDEKSRRVGQSIAAASLPILE